MTFLPPPRFLTLGIHQLTTRFFCTRVRTLTGKEIELDIEPDYKVKPTNNLERSTHPVAITKRQKTSPSPKSELRRTRLIQERGQIGLSDKGAC